MGEPDTDAEAWGDELGLTAACLVIGPQADATRRSPTTASRFTLGRTFCALMALRSVLGLRRSQRA